MKNIYIQIALIYLYLWGVRNAYYIIFQPDDPDKSILNFLIKIILLPLSWLTVFGILLIEMGKDVTTDYYKNYNEEDRFVHWGDEDEVDNDEEEHGQ